MHVHSRVAVILLLCVALVTLSACGSSATNTSTPTPSGGLTPTVPVTAAVTQTPSATLVPLQITGVSIALNPGNLTTVNCGTTMNIVFTAVVSVNAGSAGGTIPYNWNVNHSAIPGSITFAPGQTALTVTYTVSNYTFQLASSSAISGSISVGNPGNVLTSSTVVPTGHCNLPGPFQVVSISISTSPASISSITCGTTITVTYIATVIIAANSNAGTVSLVWSAIYKHPAATITFAPAQTVGTTSVTLIGRAATNSVFLQPVSISSTAPNAYRSAGVTPAGAGQCA